ncbi:MAG: helix-turn-helix domain-containing protein [Clostridia bacterium]|nr:helix-turn-helix domain-containing protein [Clostridia bacterium]
MDIGRRIAEARAAANVTQQELADKLFVSRDLVAKWEQGKRRPDHRMIEQVAAALSVRPEAIITRSEYVFRELRSCIPNGAEFPEARLSALISSFLRDLPEKEANIFIRRYYLLESNAEIALRYGIKQNQVRSRLSKTVKKLGQTLKEVYDDERH